MEDLCVEGDTCDAVSIEIKSRADLKSKALVLAEDCAAGELT